MLSEETSINVPTNYQKLEWIHEDKILEGNLAISTAMKKVYQFYINCGKNPNKKRKVMAETKQQPSILNFFNKKWHLDFYHEEQKYA